MELKKLKIGRWYEVNHKRKKRFVAKLVGVEDAEPGDPQDEVFLTMKIDTSPGSGSEWLQRAKGANVTEVNIRPSLVQRMSPVSAPGRKRRPGEPKEARREEGIGEKLKNLLGFRR